MHYPDVIAHLPSEQACYLGIRIATEIQKGKLEPHHSELGEAKQFSGYIFITPIGMLFVSCLIVANITAQKPIHLSIFNLPDGVLIFPFSYIFANILTEVYGYKWARLLIWMSIPS